MSTKTVAIVANRGTSKSSHKETQCKRQAEIAFFVSNECTNRVSITRIWNRVMNFELGPGTQFLLQITTYYYNC